MQVRRKTPILEARQFTAESALSLISDGWLKGVEVVDGSPVGLVTRSASRSAAVPLNGWIVLEYVDEPTIEIKNGVGEVHETPETAPSKRFRPLSAEQFTEDFEVVKRTTVENIPPLNGRGIMDYGPVDPPDVRDQPPADDTSSGEVAKVKSK